MDEFSPGINLLLEKGLCGPKESRKKSQLRADVKRKIRQRFRRERKNQTDNNTVPSVIREEQNIFIPNGSEKVENGAYLAIVVDKLWSIQRNPQLRIEKFVYSGRVPCFLSRNINGAVNKSKRQRNKRRRPKRAETYSLWQNKKPKTQNTRDEFYFRIRRSNTKRSPQASGEGSCLRTLSSKRLASTGIGQHQTKRLCLEFEPNVNNDGSFDAVSTKKISNSDSHVEEVSAGTDQTIMEIFNDRRKYYQRTQSSLKKFKAKTKKDFGSDSTNSQDIRKPFNDPRVKLTKSLRVTLEDCFAQGLQDKGKLTQTTSTPKAMKVNLLPSSHVASSLHTPRPPIWRVTTSDTSPLVPTSYTSSRVPIWYTSPGVPVSYTSRKATTSDTLPRVPTSDTLTRVPTSYVTPGVPSSHTTQRKVTSKSTPRVPSSHITPAPSDFSGTDNESSFFTKRKKAVGEKCIVGKADRNIIYKPLFSNRPRLWKSVVVENDD